MTRIRWMTLLSSLTLFLVSGCFGSANVTYIDSSRTPASDSHTSSLGDGAEGCGSAGLALANTYASYFDRIIRVMTMQLVQPRHIEITCAKDS